MKKAMLLLLGLGIILACGAQVTDKLVVKKIEVIGTAETEVIPDEIILNITLKEYYKGKEKVLIEKLEQQLQKAVWEAGIPHENFSIENIFGYNNDWWWRNQKKDPNFLARKQYRLKLSRLDKVNQILSALESEGIESVSIGAYAYSKMAQVRKEVKTKALQAAREKAIYLLNAIGEQIGAALEIREINTDQYSDVHNDEMANTRMMLRNAAPATQDAAQAGIDFKPIKVRAEIHASFAIK